MSFVIDLLDSCLVVIDQGDDRIPVTGILDWFDNNEIAICDMFIAHGVTTDTKSEAARSEQIGRDSNGFTGQHGFDGKTSCDDTQKRNLVLASDRRGLNQLDTTLDIFLAANEPSRSRAASCSWTVAGELRLKCS